MLGFFRRIFDWLAMHPWPHAAHWTWSDLERENYILFSYISAGLASATATKLIFMAGISRWFLLIPVALAISMLWAWRLWIRRQDAYWSDKNRVLGTSQEQQ